METPAKRIALYGGTFDPFHNAHREVVRSALSQLPVDCVFVMPLGQAPHKNRRISPAAFRFEMARLGVEGIEGAIVSDDEISTPGVDYTYETVLRLKEQFDPEIIYILAGSDVLSSIDSWFRVRDLLREATLAVVRRGSDHSGDMQAKAKELQKRCGARVVFFDMPPLTLASSDLRARIEKGQALNGQCPAQVESLIQRHHLYTFSSVYSSISAEKWSHLIEMEGLSWPYLSQERRVHSASVAQYAGYLASLTGVDIARAMECGLLHDLAKQLPLREQRELAGAFLKDDVMLAAFSDELLHGPAAAKIISTFDDSRDEEFLNAIAFHSTARPGMSSLEQILFLSDKIAYDRTFCRLEPIRALAEGGELRAAMACCLREVFNALVREGIALNPISLAAYREYAGDSSLY